MFVPSEGHSFETAFVENQIGVFGQTQVIYEHFV